MAKQPELLPGAESSASAVADSSKKSGGKLGKLLLIPLVLAPFALGGWLAYTKYPQIAAASTAVASVFGTEDAEAEEQKIEFGEFMELNNLIVNPQDSGGTRFLMVSVGLESKKASALEELKGREVVVRDLILKQLSQQTVGELADITLRNTIKEDLLKAINGIVKEGKIDRLYFTQYVLQ